MVCTCCDCQCAEGRAHGQALPRHNPSAEQQAGHHCHGAALHGIDQSHSQCPLGPESSPLLTTPSQLDTQLVIGRPSHRMSRQSAGCLHVPQVFVRQLTRTVYSACANSAISGPNGAGSAHAIDMRATAIQSCLKSRAYYGSRTASNYIPTKDARQKFRNSKSACNKGAGPLTPTGDADRLQPQALHGQWVVLSVLGDVCMILWWWAGAHL